MHSRTTAREIIDDFEGEQLDYWVTGYGTGGTLKGVARVLREGAARHQDRRLRAGRRASCSAAASSRRAMPDGSPAAAHPAFKPHPMQGWTPDFIPKLTGDAVDMKRDRPASCRSPGAEAIRCSQRAGDARKASSSASPSGATFAGALQVAAEAPKGANILCMLPDTGERYLSTPLFADIPADMTDGGAGDLALDARPRSSRPRRRSVESMTDPHARFG